ncbi:MAG: glycosyl hydrolase family 88 [Oscillospiraceae bacterium]|nr:glycosyl hydrolase family 88 [Oscillospiraceae bacterium]
MKKQDKKKQSSKQSSRKRWLPVVGIVVVVVVVLLWALVLRTPGNVREYQEKAALLKEQALAADVVETLGDSPAGSAGYAVFLSVCDGSSRANVYSGTGSTPENAWKSANHAAEAALKKSHLQPRWVKADVVCETTPVPTWELKSRIYASRHEFFRYGLAFDENFDPALLEAEMNGAKIYEYDQGGVDLKYLNTYLKKSDRPQLDSLPDEYYLFTCKGWFCDEDGTVYRLIDEGLDYGHREVDLVDAEYAEWLLENATSFLLEQVNEDGSFVYGIYPRFDNDIDNYNIVRHASTIWSLIIRYRMSPDPELQRTIESTLDYLLNYVIYADENTAYLYEEKADEIKLGGCGVAVIAMTEYMDVFQNDRYADVCRALGNGILTMMDPNTGTYVHVLNGDFSLKEEMRTVYYDGEATFALCRLYGLTGDQRWLNAACAAADHFIAADYAQYKDHWVAYAMNELTMYVPDRTDYYAFGLKNAQDNLEAIAQRDTTYHTYLELLMVTFELYDRMVENGISADNFDLPMFLQTIYTRVNRQLNGFFYPEYAMYMANPDRILYTFMVRHDGYRVRIDDVQHNIDGYYLYWKNYDKLVEYGLLDYID